MSSFIQIGFTKRPPKPDTHRFLGWRGHRLNLCISSHSEFEYALTDITVVVSIALCGVPIRSDEFTSYSQEYLKHGLTENKYNEIMLDVKAKLEALHWFLGIAKRYKRNPYQNFKFNKSFKFLLNSE